MNLENLTAEQIRQALINSKRRPVNDSARIKQAIENHKRGERRDG